MNIMPAHNMRGVELRRHGPDRLNRADAVHDLHDLGDVDAMTVGPCPPIAHNGGGRVDQDAVQVKEERVASQFIHHVAVQSSSRIHRHF